MDNHPHITLKNYCDEVAIIMTTVRITRLVLSFREIFQFPTTFLKSQIDTILFSTTTKIPRFYKTQISGLKIN